MTVSLEQIRDKISPRFPYVEQVDESVLRFEKTSHGNAYAVCYVDVSKEIPESAAALSSYQERVVARRYFQGRKSLQWSNYVYFVVDKPPQHSKAIIECDRKYARKFVLTEPELDTALSPPSFKVSDTALKTDILTTWINILSDAQLDRAILNDESLPRRLELIEAFFAQGMASPSTANVVPRASAQPFLRQINLKSFRPFPVLREFDFGTVTLICGANGTGKTSLMEAVELVYCGRNKRNPQSTDAYTIFAKYADGTEENATQRRSASIYRERNLVWFGQSEQRTNNLFQTFSRFNFLNTDAAVGLAEAKEELEEDLSKLLVGPEASKTWKEIGRTADKLDDKIKELGSLLNQAELEEASLNRQIAASGELKQESRAVLKKLDETLESVDWKRSEGDVVASVKRLVESLSEYDIHVKAAIACEWAGAPVTLLSLRQFVSAGDVRSEIAERLVNEYREGATSESQCVRELSQIEQRLSEMIELSKYIDVGLPELLAEAERLTALIVRHEQMFANIRANDAPPHLLNAGTVSVAAIVRSSADELESTTLQLSKVQERYSNFSALRDESASLSQRLRDVASQILERSAAPDTCPLCRTSFPPGELSKHIHAGLDPQIEETAAALLTEIRKNQSLVDLAKANERAAKWAENACGRLGEPTSIAVSQLLKLLLDSQEANVRHIEAKERLTAELTALETSGLRAERYQQLFVQVSLLHPVSSARQLKEECDQLEQLRARKVDKRESYRIKNQEVLSRAAEAVATAEVTVASVASALSQLREQLASTKKILANMERCIANFPCPSDRPLSELAITIGAIRTLAGDYQATHSKEQSVVAVLAETSNRKKQLETQIAGLRPRIERFVDARHTLSKIQSEHSLSGAMDEALRQNRNAIEAIFARIHSPAEFSGLGETLTTLVRKAGGQNATLQQISTGQRAAFALSLFLAQNAQLRTAPPLILIDDPIAHVDDLNCLSFLDYLREVVVGGDRQVVFATANEKLAMLFERKFDFLGEEDFRRYDLSR